MWIIGQCAAGWWAGGKLQRLVGRLPAVAFGLCLLLAVTLLGCAESVTTGTVIDHHYEGPYETTTLICAGYDRNGLCQFYMPLTQPIQAGRGASHLWTRTGPTTPIPRREVSILAQSPAAARAALRHHDESWWLTLQNCENLDPEDRPPRTTQVRYEDCRHGDVRVDATTYAETRFGSWWPSDGVLR